MARADSVDPRPLFRRALDQMEHQAAAVGPDELGHPTPCAEYDVRALLGHLVAVLGMLARVGAAGDSSDLAEASDGLADDDWGGAFRRARAEVERVWADDAALERTGTLSWATLPGRAIDAYTHELTVHSWDLAYATERLGELDPDLGAHALDWFTHFLPSDARNGQEPFGPAVPVPDDADIYTRLAAYTGRQP